LRICVNNIFTLPLALRLGPYLGWEAMRTRRPALSISLRFLLAQYERQTTLMSSPDTMTRTQAFKELVASGELTIQKSWKCLGDGVAGRDYEENPVPHQHAG
jgi:hypothetical protein